MDRNPSPVEFPQPEDVRFQVSLLRLVYPNTASSPQLAELEGLLNPPSNLAPAH